MRKDIRTGMYVGIGLVFVGWVLFALFSDTLQERRQKQLVGKSPVSVPDGQRTESQKQPVQNPPSQKHQTTAPAEPAPVQLTEQIHAVQPGQTLSSISVLYYGSSDQWQKILEANSDILKNDPTKLRPGMQLKIPAK